MAVTGTRSITVSLFLLFLAFTVWPYVFACGCCSCYKKQSIFRLVSSVSITWYSVNIFSQQISYLYLSNVITIFLLVVVVVEVIFVVVVVVVEPHKSHVFLQISCVLLCCIVCVVSVLQYPLFFLFKQLLIFPMS